MSQPDDARSRCKPAGFLFALFLLLAAVAPAQEKKAKSLRGHLFDMMTAFDADVATRRVRAKLDVFELELKERLAGKSGRDIPKTFAAYFFEEQLLASDPDLSDPDNFYLHRVLEGRQGFCLSLSAVLLVTARRLGLPIHGVAAPRHFFVRYDDGKVRYNIETTESGAERSDAFYRSHGVTPRAESEGVFLVDLDDAHVVAYLLNNEGFIRLCAGDLDGADKCFVRALAIRPNLVEAIINRGVVAGERGNEDEAKRLFTRSLTWLPDDGPLHFNRALAGLRAGRFEEALAELDESLSSSKDPGALDRYRQLLMATVLRDRHWKRYQREVVARGEKLRAAGRLRGGLRGRYYGDLRCGRLVGERVDRDVQFQWRWSPPYRGVGSRNFSVRWDGYVDVPAQGVYQFFLVFEQGVRLWVDGVRFIDFSRGKADKLAQETVVLAKGLHSIRVEYLAPRKPNGILFSVKRAEANRPLSASDCFFHLPD